VGVAHLTRGGKSCSWALYRYLPLLLELLQHILLMLLLLHQTKMLLLLKPRKLLLRLLLLFVRMIQHILLMLGCDWQASSQLAGVSPIRCCQALV